MMRATPAPKEAMVDDKLTLLLILVIMAVSAYDSFRGNLSREQGPVNRRPQPRRGLRSLPPSTRPQRQAPAPEQGPEGPA